MTTNITATDLSAFLSTRHPNAAEFNTILCVFSDWFAYMRADFVF